MTPYYSLKMILVALFTGALSWACQCGQKGDGPAVIPAGELLFEDRFDRDVLGPDWSGPNGSYRIVEGKLVAEGAKNRPLWLKTKLPRNAKVEFKASASSPAIDIKAELWGDGKSVPTTASYKATAYVVILGGWNNSRSIIARMDEHGKDRQSRKEPKATSGRPYGFTIVRQGSLFSWFVDGQPFLELDDSNPLEGPGHEYFAFNNWKSKVIFDDFVVYKL
jgi:hypothetical protein